MSAFRTFRTLVVDANQCRTDVTIAADNGFRHVKRGEWIIRGENGECYVVDDTFFQKTFAPVEPPPFEEQAVFTRRVDEGRHYGA